MLYELLRNEHCINSYSNFFLSESVAIILKKPLWTRGFSHRDFKPLHSMDDAVVQQPYLWVTCNNAIHTDDKSNWKFLNVCFIWENIIHIDVFVVVLVPSMILNKIFL